MRCIGPTSASPPSLRRSSRKWLSSALMEAKHAAEEEKAAALAAAREVSRPVKATELAAMRLAAEAGARRLLRSPGVQPRSPVAAPSAVRREADEAKASLLSDAGGV